LQSTNKKLEPGTEMRSSMKKILPFWIAAITFAVTGAILLHINSVRLINYIEYPETNPNVLAEAYMEEAEKEYRNAFTYYTGIKDNPSCFELMKKNSSQKKAKEIFTETLKVRPNMPGIYKYLANLSSFEGDKTRMYYYQGMRARSEKQPEAAILAFNKSIETDSTFLLSGEEKTLALIELGKLDEAEKSIRDILTYSKNHASSWYIKSRVDRMKRNEQDLKTDLENALKLDPKHLKASKELGDLLSMKGKLSKAAEIFEKARKYYPRDANLLHKLALVYIKKIEYKKAEKCFTEALKLEKHSASLYFDFARLYEKMEKPSHSTAMLQKAIAINPEFKNKILFPEKK
jgi:tetratricopeptide (TPR) repeat protein